MQETNVVPERERDITADGRMHMHAKLYGT